MAEHKTKTYIYNGRRVRFNYKLFEIRFNSVATERGGKKAAEIFLKDKFFASESTIRSWRDGRNAPSDIECIKKIADYFKLPVEDFLVEEIKKEVLVEDEAKEHIEASTSEPSSAEIIKDETRSEESTKNRNKKLVKIKEIITAQIQNVLRKIEQQNNEKTEEKMTKMRRLIWIVFVGLTLYTGLQISGILASSAILDVFGIIVLSCLICVYLKMEFYMIGQGVLCNFSLNRFFSVCISIVAGVMLYVIIPGLDECLCLTDAVFELGSIGLVLAEKIKVYKEIIV